MLIRGQVGIAVAKLFREVELQTLSYLDGASSSGGVYACEALGSICGGTQDALAVAATFLLTPVERGTAADRDKRVLEERAPRRVGMDIPGGDRVDAKVLGKVTQSGITSDVATLVRSLQLNEEVPTTERAR